MRKVTLLGLALIVAIAAALGGDIVQAQHQSSGNTGCVLDGDNSPGLIVKRGGEYYRCLYVFGDNLVPAGANWVKMVTTDGHTFVPKEPSEGR